MVMKSDAPSAIQHMAVKRDECLQHAGKFLKHGGDQGGPYVRAWLIRAFAQHKQIRKCAERYCLPVPPLPEMPDELLAIWAEMRLT